MRWIYISPHLDDAALSAGGLIYEQTRSGDPVEMWTFMCGFPPKGELSPFAEALHKQWGTTDADETIRTRRAEDKNAAAILGATAVHFDFLDCIYRRSKAGEWMYADIYVPMHEGEADLPRQIADTIAAHLQPDDRLVCQFAIGPHIDHLIVRNAVELLGKPLVYDADIPYLFNFPEQLPEKTAGLKETIHPVSEAGLKAWEDSIAAYDSQLSMLFETPGKMREAITDYCNANGGIRTWTKA
jgi:LmbE family N-acetylglucosaminyl deacetylase